jgi:hypothetical protein
MATRRILALLFMISHVLEISSLFVLPLENATLRMTDILYNPIVMQYSHYVQLVQKKKNPFPSRHAVCAYT